MKAWVHELVKFEWLQARWRRSLSCVPAIVVCLIGAAVWGQPAAGLVGAGACLALGLAAIRQVEGAPFGAMAWTMTTMAFCAVIGTLVGDSSWLDPLTIAGAGFIFALLSIYNDNVGWIAMQGVISLLLATAFPAHGLAATERAIAILAGGTVQIIALALAWQFWSVRRSKGEKTVIGTPGPLYGYGYHWTKFSESLTFSSIGVQYAIRVAITMVLATELAKRLPIENGYWLPMTTIIVLKPDFYRTYSGGVQRVIGTLVGVAVASAIADFFHPAAGWLIALVGIFSFFSFALLKVNTMVFASALTAYVVFLIATTGIPESSVTVHRLINTALGCALAMTSRLIGYRILLRFFARS